MDIIFSIIIFFVFGYEVGVNQTDKKYEYCQHEDRKATVECDIVLVSREDV